MGPGLFISRFVALADCIVGWAVFFAPENTPGNCVMTSRDATTVGPEVELQDASYVRVDEWSVSRQTVQFSWTGGGGGQGSENSSSTMTTTLQGQRPDALVSNYLRRDFKIISTEVFKQHISPFLGSSIS